MKRKNIWNGLALLVLACAGAISAHGQSADLQRMTFEQSAESKGSAAGQVLEVDVENVKVKGPRHSSLTASRTAQGASTGAQALGSEKLEEQTIEVDLKALKRPVFETTQHD